MRRTNVAQYACALAAITFGACDLGSVSRPNDVSEGREAPTRVADTVDILIESPAIAAADLNNDNRPVWSYEISATTASYIAPHFADATIPDGASLVVRSPDSGRSWSYTQTDINRKLAVADGFWGIHVWGTSAIVELFTSVPLPAGAVIIDGFAKGFEGLALNDEGNPDIVAVCGANDGLNPICYASSEPNAYNKGKSVARLVINGSWLCTGWLLGSEGHVMTNNHCIENASQAANTTFDFMAEGASCSTNCDYSGACGGTIVASSATFVTTDSTLDYTLVKLPSNPTGTYGYLQLRETGAKLNERIYIPEHSSGWGKQLQMEQDGYDLTVTSTTYDGGSTCGSNQVTYSSDTEGGSSGSPVLGYNDNLVVALHHCGATSGCNGLGVRIQSIISDMGGYLPNNALGGGSPDPYCGDGSCNGSETCSTCETDCGACGDPDPYCGDGSCNGTETCSSCETDCGACGGTDQNSCQETNSCGGKAPGGCWCDSACTTYGDCCFDGPCTAGPYCGDGSCNGTETCDSCEADCGPCPDEPDPSSCLETSSCGYKAPGGCWCDNACTAYGDCCSDGPC